MYVYTVHTHILHVFYVLFIFRLQVNFTIEPSVCLREASFMSRLLAATVIGYDEIVVNMFMFSMRSKGLLKNTQVRKKGREGKGTAVVDSKRSGKEEKKPTATAVVIHTCSAPISPPAQVRKRKRHERHRGWVGGWVGVWFCLVWFGPPHALPDNVATKTTRFFLCECVCWGGEGAWGAGVTACSLMTMGYALSFGTLCLDWLTIHPPALPSPCPNAVWC